MTPHVAQVSFFLDPRNRDPLELLRDWPTLVDVADAARRGGSRVSVIQACARTETLTHRDVAYYFLAPEAGKQTLSRSATFAELLRDLAPDVFHVHGIGYPRDVMRLAKLARGAPILLQDHANQPPRFWRRSLWRKALSAVAAVSFCARQQAAPFEQVRLFGPSMHVNEIPESTSRFSPGNQDVARRITGIDGDPCLVWVGHLDANKDPLTVLAGVSAAVQHLPRLKLWCYFGTAPLLGEVRRRISQDPQLESRVNLVGSVAHMQVEHVMRAADLFVLGSHREGSGYSLLEAMACGLPPVVSDIPSFRSLTGGGTVGKLWPCDDAQRLSEALVSTWALPTADLRRSVRAHFDRELSSEAVGRKLTAAYRRMLERNVMSTHRS